MNDELNDVGVGGSYPFAQLAKAFVTALTHEDQATRERASGRIEQWASVLKGMATGRLRIGSRAPIAGLPVWATPTVVRGGFATGPAAAAGPLTPFERDVAQRNRVEAKREAVFAYCLTEEGLADLHGSLQAGEYDIDIPEAAALLTVTWLVAGGDREAALTLAATLAPLADDLRFTPQLPAGDRAPRTIVWRQTAHQTTEAVEKRGPNGRVEAMRETLQVWNPLADQALALWLETVEAGRVGATKPEGWSSRARDLIANYEELASTHTRVRKHLRPKENLAILMRALRAAVDRDVPPRLQGLLQHAVDSMVARRGAPNSPTHIALRSSQAHVAAKPSHHALARVVVRRLSAQPAHRGLDGVDELLLPVNASEAVAFDVSAGTQIPRSIKAVVRRGLAAAPEELIERRIVPSAEVLAELVPRIAAAAIADTYENDVLGELMAATYEAFRRRRTLLLLNLEHQVRFEELPWVSAVASRRRRDAAIADNATNSLARLAQLALEAFPATITPSALVSEMDVLSREAGLQLPLVEELAADIFMGTFSAKFVRAAQLAAELLEGSLYARYYAVDYAAVRAIDDLASTRERGPQTSAKFDALCFARAGVTSRGSSVAANGKVLEQAQILTTHNLAAIAGPRGVGDRLALDWAALADRCLNHAFVLTARLHNNPRPLRTVKDLAYAWRQMIFFTTMGGPGVAHDLVVQARSSLAHKPEHVATRLAPAIEGLAIVVSGSDLDAAPHASARRLLGWTTSPHWILAHPPTDT